MRNYLHLFLLLLSINLIAQTDDDCATALGAVTGVSTGTMVTDNTTGYNEEPDYLVGLFGQTISGYTAFTWSGGDGFFSINVTGIATGDWNISLSQDCDFTTSSSLYQGPLDPAVATEVGCLYLEGGVDYVLGYATDSGNEGNIEFEFINPITVSPAANSVCTDAEEVVAGGIITTNCEANNISGDLSSSCPLTNPGLCLDLGSGEILWYTFTTDNNVEEVTIVTNGSAITPQIGLYDGSCTGLSEVSCDDTGNATIAVSPNTQYWLAVGEATGGAGLGGMFSLDITASLTPLGDDCGVETLTMGVATTGTTTCASAPTVGFCGLGINDHAVYFDFEVTGTANVDLEINLASSTFTTGTAATNIGFEIFGAACGALPTVLPITGDCSGFALTTLECVPPGLYSIAIGSTDMMAGDYEVTLSQNVVGPANDACANADNTVALNGDCSAVTLSGTTVDACPEGFTGPACPYDMESVVWHEITLPTDAIGIEVLNITGGVGITVFTDNVCPIPGGFFPDANCITTDSPPITGMTGGDSYLIGVSTDPAAESAYTFDVLAIVPPANDLCGAAELLSDATPMNGSNNCATADAFCSLDATTSHVVWYQYDISGSLNTGLNINVSADGASTTPMTGVSIQVLDGCGGTIIDDASAAIGGDDDCLNPLGMDLEYECLEGGTSIWIAVGSNDTEEGDFIITVSQVDPAPANDECDMATDIDLSAAPCMIVPVVGDNSFACPESFDADGCTYSTDPAVWYSVTLPTDAVGLEITDLTTGFYATYITGGCGGSSFDGTDGCFTDAGNTATTYSAGDVIHIAIASTTADEGAFDFNILAVVPPANDMCATPEDISATAAAGVDGTTACATPPAVDYCGLGTTTSHVVYYTYTVGSAINTDLSITITGAGAEPTTGIAVELYTDCAGTIYPNNTEVDGDDPCTALDTELNYECVAPGTVLTIAVGSAEGAEGGFNITITEDNTGTPTNDGCDDAIEIIFANNCVFETVTTDNTGACPEVAPFDALTSCDLDQDAVIWFEAFMPNSGVGFEFAGIDGGEYVAVFSGDCTTPVQEDDCLTTDGQILGLAGNATYLIAVSLDAAAEGAIEFEIKTITPPFNDICNPDAADLTDGVLSQGTTACATSDNMVCTLGDNDHVVYYTYTVTATTNTDLTIVTEPSTVTTGTAAMDLVTDVWLDCAGTDFMIDPEEGNTEECNAAVAQTLTYLCVPPGTVLTIAVGSTNGMDGDFTITVDEDADGIPTATNDLCDAPEALVVDPPCEWIPFSVSSVNACPEAADLPNNCGFDDNPITWYTFDTPADAASVEINIVSSSAGNPIYTLFNNDCADPNNALPTALVDCESGLGEISAPIDVTPNTTYLLGIGSNDPAGSDLEIEIKINVPPANDDPCDAETLTAGATTAGTNLCATEDFGDPNCATAQAEASVWYTYTLQPGETGVEVSFPSITAVGPINATVVTFDGGCTAAPTLATATSFTCDASTLTDPITLNCLDEGTVLHINVSSEDANAGDFEILLEVINPDPLCIDNDECDMLGGGADQGVITTDDDCAVINDCNANACAEFIGDCGIEVNNVVWYSVTNDGLGEFISASIENADFDEPVIAIFDGSCAALNQIGNCEFGSGGVANAGPFMIPADGAQYWIAVGSVGAVGGDFELCIEINSGCVNDEPCDGVELMNGVTVDNPASTVSCTQDVQNPECTAGGIVSSVWYTFTVPEGFNSFEISLGNVTIAGDIGIQVGDYSDANCAALPASDHAWCEPGQQTQLVPCTPEGSEYYIQISSGEDMDEGDFEITINALEPTLENDLCSGIGPDQTFEITEDDYCMFVTISAETTDGCPEIFTAAGCDFTVGPASWYEVTIPNDPGIETMDIMGEVIDGFAGNLQIAVLQVDCDDVLGGTAVDCMSSGGDIDDFNDIPVTPGETYQILVGSDTADDDGRLNLSVKVDAPPENDNPCPTDVNPPIDLSGNGSHDGSTCCARGANDDPAVDFANADCSGATDDDAVWYTFTPSGAGDGFYVYVQSAGGADGIMGNTAVEVYSTMDPNGGCTGNLTFEDSSCGSVASEIEIAISLCDPTLLYYIKVASAEDDCGDFTISILERTSDCAADECPDAEVLVTETPAGCEDGENILTIDGCLEFACPEDVNIACSTDQGPTVWYQIDIDSDQATILVTQVEAEGFDVVWNIWQSTTGSCDDMIPVSQPQPAPEPALPCSDSDGDPANNLIIPIVQDPPGTPATYWISITALGEITDPNFTLNYAGSLGCIACSGDDSFDCDNGEYEATIDGEVVELEDYENFCPGQEVEVCVAFNYNTAGTGNDWLHGIIPTFGNGWDLEASDIESVDLGGGWEWVADDGACATNTSIYDLPNLCTYNNDDGVLQLCNTACDPNCPCEGPLEADSPLPSGWFWNSDGGSTTCVNGSCIPLEQYGVPGGVNVDVDVCFDLVVKSFEDLDGDGEPDEDCAENRDLQIVFQTTSDAVSGCWEDNPCIIDPSITGPAWLINCDTPPDVLGDDAEICNMDMLDIAVTTEDGSAVEIVVEVIDNPNVDGETDFNFPGGFGTIDNTLTNTSGAVEVVVYEVYSVDPTKPCPGITNTIEVTVYPELEIEFNNPLVVCAGESIEVIATPSGGTGNYVTYQWGAPGFETTPSITVTPVTTTTYVITVTDDLGCTGSSEVEVFWNPPVEFELVPSMESICQNGEETTDADDILFVDVVFSSGTAPFTINWDFDPGFGDLDNIINNTVNSNDQLEVFEETSVAGTYTVFVEVEDANGCFEEAQIDIEIGGAPFIIVQPVEVPCGGTEETVLIDAAAFFTSGPPVSMMELYTCDGILIFSNNGNSAAWEVDPNEYNCVVVVAIDQNGCQATEEIELDLNAGPEPTLTGASHCVGETSEVSVDDAGNYTMFEWNDDGPSTGSTITADRDTNFIYVVTVTDSEGCTGVASFEVLVDPNPSISLAGSLSYCSGSTTTLTASGGDSYSWVQEPSGTEVSNMADVVINTPGDYTVIVTNAEGCTSDSTVTVIEDANLLVTLNTLELCDGDIDTLSAGESFDIYEWEDGDGNNIGSDYFVEVGGGTYCVTVTDSAAGCTGSTCTTITPNISPTVMVSDTVDICREDVGLAPGVILNFNDQVMGGVSGTWIDLDFPGVDITTDLTMVDFTDINLGVYAFEYRTNTAIAPCEDARDTMYVNVINCTCPSVDVLGPPTLCNTAGDMFNLDDLKNTNEDVTWTSTGANMVTITGGNMVDLSGLAAGTYEFTMTLVNPVGGNCPETNTASFIIVEEAIAEAVDASVCNEDTGNGPTTIDLNTTLTATTTTDGEWTDASGAVVSNIFDGDPFDPGEEFVFTYTVSGDDPCGDVSTDVTIMVIDCDCPQVMITDPEAICNDAGTVNLDDQIVTTEPGTWVYVSGGTGGTVPLDAGNVFNSVGLTSGLYVYNYVFDNDPGGDCPSEFPINIIVSNQPIVTAVAASPCNTMSAVGSTFVDLTQQISGDTGNGSWAIDPGSEAIELTNPDLINNVTAVNFDGQPIGSMWSFTFTAVATAPCVPATANVIVTVSDCDCPNVDVMEPAAVCNSETTPLDLSTLEGPMIGDGSWSVMDPLGMNVALSGTELSLDGIDAGDYMLTYTLDPVPAGDCQADSTVILSVSAQNFATLGMDQEVCVNDGSNGANFIDFTTLVVAGATDGMWADTDGSGVDLTTDITNVSFEGVDADMAFTFTYTVSSDAPCVEETYTIEINTLPCDCPLANPMDPAIECSDVGVVDLSQYDNATFSGSWSSDDLTITDNMVDLTDVAAGVYTLTYTMDNPVDGCPSMWDTTIEVANPATAGTPEAAAVFCEDETETVALADLLTDEDAGGVWTETSGTLSTGGAFDPAGTFDMSGQAPGSYTFMYSITGDAPCMDVMESVEVIVEAVPNADAGDDVELDCITTMTTIGGSDSSMGSMFTYQWTLPNGTPIEGATQSTLEVASGDAGTYILVVTNSDTGCTNEDEVVVSVSDDVPSFEFAPVDISCNGEGDGMITIINPMGGNGDYTYSFDGGPFEATTEFTNLESGDYIIVMEDSSGSGCSSTQTVTITEPGLLILDLGPPVQTNLGNEVSFSIADQLGDFEIDNIVWTVGGEEICSDPTCESILIEADQNTNVTVEVTYNGGCIATAVTQIQVSQVVDVILPNVFSPNNDGNNEVFYVNSDDVETVLSMRIYDRWGELVFVSENQPASDPSYGWNGTFKGEPVNPGVFVYVVEVLFINGTTEQIGGDVTIVR